MKEEFIPVLQNYFNEEYLDILEKFAFLLKKGSMTIRADGKIDLRTAIPYDSVWVHTNIDSGRMCTMYSDIIRNYLKFIHTRCFSCWKVVSRPRTVSELFECFEIQNDMGLHSKSGIEVRDHVEANYGQYWYNDSLEQGLECKEKVIKALPDGVPVFLKRGCTEFEIMFGDSDTWKLQPKQLEREKLLADLIVIPFDPSQNWPWYVHLNTQRKWVRFAAARGDMTYLEKTDGKHINTHYRRYTDTDLEGEFANPQVMCPPDGFPNKEF